MVNGVLARFAARHAARRSLVRMWRCYSPSLAAIDAGVIKNDGQTD